MKLCSHKLLTGMATEQLREGAGQTNNETNRKKYGRLRTKP